MKGSRRFHTAHVRHGFVLMAMLWLITAAGLLAAAALMLGRDSVSTAEYRLEATRARWLAEGCANRAHAAAAVAMRGTGDSVTRAWDQLDERIASSTWVSEAGCAIASRAAGTGIDLTELDESGLRRLFAHLGVGGAAVDSLTDAVLDWIDADDAPRQFGAESAWYMSADMLAPRNGAIADATELLDVRGVAALDPLARRALLVALEPGSDRLAFGHAHPAALAALPGFSEEAVARVLALRDARSSGEFRGALDLSMIRDGLSIEARTEFDRHATRIAALTTMLPDAWHVRASVDPWPKGSRAQPFAVEYRLVRSGAAVVVTRGSTLR